MNPNLKRTPAPKSARQIVVQAPPPDRPTGKVAIALQFWAGDIKQAAKLSRFITDLQPHHAPDVDFLFVARFDCPHDAEMAKYASRKFNVRQIRSKRRGKGWPHGCNDLWFGLMDELYLGISAHRLPQYKFVFTFEADNVPVSPRWLQHFIKHWDAANAEAPTYVMGAELLSPAQHINGNALFSCRMPFLHWLTRDVNASHPKMGWDYFLAHDFRKWGTAIMPDLQSYWNTTTFSPQDVENCFGRGDVWVHGIKDDSLLDAARKRLL